MASKRGVAGAIAGLLGLSLAGPPASAADTDVQQRIQEMKQRMQKLDDQLQAASDQLQSANQRVDEQSALIEQSGIVETRGAASGLPGFLGEITVTGNISATYFYNVNDPNDAPGNIYNGDEGGLQNTNIGLSGDTGNSAGFYPLQPDHNSFSFQALWLTIARETDEEHRGGFLFEPVYGKTGQVNNVGGIGNRDEFDDTGLYLNQAYVEYLAPIGDGLTFQAGKFITWIGLEQPNSLLNWNITQGNLYQLIEPLDQIGVQAIYEFGDSGFDAALGGVNGYLPNDPDINDGKSVLGHVGWTSDDESLSVSVNGLWGPELQGRDGNESGVVNANLSWQATDALAFWVNGDYAWIDASGDPAAWGIAAAGQYAFTERTGVAIRGEYVADVDQYLGFIGIDDEGDLLLSNGDLAAYTGVEMWSLTGTLSHELTDHLLVRGEVRYDHVDKDDTKDGEFFQNSDSFSDDQIVLGAEITYSFTKLGGE